MADALKRRIGLPLLTAYGVGVMVGAGIYVLVGAVAAEAGIWAPLAFLLAGMIAAPTALSYAEFSTRLPEAGGEAVYVSEGLGIPSLGALIGLAIVITGSISGAAVLRGGAGYLTAITPIPAEVAIVVMGGLLIAVALVGVLESLALAALFTAVELIGLGIVVWVGLSTAPVADLSAAAPPVWTGVGAAAVLAFFAFIGFEDIVNMAEEVKRPEKTLPRAILLSLMITSIIYAVVSYAAVRAVPLADLTVSEQPLLLVWHQGDASGAAAPAAFLSAIAVAAALNGVLAQIVMAARVLFGIGRRTPALAVFHHTSARFGTPTLATVLIGGLVTVAALVLPVSSLAEGASTLLLSIFVIVNLALIAMKRKQPEAPFRVPMLVPVLGLLAALGALAVNFGILDLLQGGAA